MKSLKALEHSHRVLYEASNPEQRKKGNFLPCWSRLDRCCYSQCPTKCPLIRREKNIISQLNLTIKVL